MLEKIRSLLRGLWDAFGHMGEFHGSDGKGLPPRSLAPGVYRIDWDNRDGI